MWSRSTLKQNAKNVLRGNYWMAFLVCLLASVLTGGLSAGGSGAQVNYNVTDTDLTQLMNGQVDPTLIAAAIGVASMAAAFGLVIGLAFNFFVYGPIKIGQMRYFLESREKRVFCRPALYGFGGEYIKNAAAMFLTDLFTALWSLLFIIPGIVNRWPGRRCPICWRKPRPERQKRARELSHQMTMGHKWICLCWGCRFIGWNLLGALACGVGVLFVAPYAGDLCRGLCVSARAGAGKGIWPCPASSPALLSSAKRMNRRPARRFAVGFAALFLTKVLSWV